MYLSVCFGIICFSECCLLRNHGLVSHVCYVVASVPGCVLAFALSACLLFFALTSALPVCPGSRLTHLMPVCLLFFLSFPACLSFVKPLILCLSITCCTSLLHVLCFYCPSLSVSVSFLVLYVFLGVHACEPLCHTLYVCLYRVCLCVFTCIKHQPCQLYRTFP